VLVVAIQKDGRVDGSIAPETSFPSSLWRFLPAAQSAETAGSWHGLVFWCGSGGGGRLFWQRRRPVAAEAHQHSFTSLTLSLLLFSALIIHLD
jgi:hypothetical protein